VDVVSFITIIAAAFWYLLYLNSLHPEYTVFTQIKAFFQKCAIRVNSGVSYHMIPRATNNIMCKLNSLTEQCG
jgi:hypothetical protein